MSTIKDRIAAAKAAQRQAERDKSKNADRSTWRKPALQDQQSRYKEQLERFERTGNDWQKLNAETASNLRKRLEAQGTTKDEREQTQSALNKTQSNIDALREAARLRSYKGLKDIEQQIADVYRLRQNIDAQAERMAQSTQGQSSAYGENRFAEALDLQRKNAQDNYDRLLSDYKAYVEREAARRAGNDRIRLANEVKYSAPKSNEGLSAAEVKRGEERRAKTFNSVIAGHEAEYYAGLINEADRISDTEEYKRYAQEKRGSIATALKKAEMAGISVANSGASSVEAATAGAWGNIVMPVVGRWIGSAIAGDLKAMLAEGGDIDKAADMATMYAYIADKHGKDTADKYWQAMRTVTKADSAAKGEASAKAFALAKPGLASVDSVIGQLEAAAPNLLAQVKQASALMGIGNDLSDDSAMLAQQRRVNDIRSTVTEGIESNVGKYAYNLGMSMADNGVRMALNAAGVPKWVTELMAAGTAAGSVLQGELDRGTDPDKALTLSIVAAVAEAVTENIGLDEIYKAARSGGSNLAKRLWNAISKATISEGAEEMLSEATNIVAEAFVLGDESQLADSIAQYMAEGRTEAGATALAVGSRIGEAGLGGALSGAVFGGVGGGIKNLTTPDIVRQGLSAESTDYREMAEALYERGGGITDMERLGLEVASDADVGYMVAKSALGGKMTDEQARAMAAALMNGDTAYADEIAHAAKVDAQTVESARAASEKAMNTRASIREDLRAGEADGTARTDNKRDVLTGAVYKSATGQALTKKEGKALAKDAGAQTLAESYKKTLAENAKEAADVEPGANAEAVEAAKNAIPTASGNAAVRVEAVRVSADGNVQVVDDTGTAHSVEDAVLSDDDAYPVTWAAQYGKGATIAYNALKTAQIQMPNTPVNKLAAAYEWAYFYGKSGTTEAHAMGSDLAADLPPTQRRTAYEAGKAMAQVQLDADIKNAAERKRAAYKGVDTTGVSDKTMSSLTADQAYTLGMAELFAKAGKVNIILTESAAEGVYGGFQESTNTIMLNINAFRSGDATGVRWTLAHELTHFAKAWAPAEWDAFKAAMLRILEEKGVDVGRLASKYKQAYAERKITISDADALEEVVCQGAQELLENSKLAEKLAREDASLFERILDALKKILAGIDRLITGKNPDPTALAVQSEVQKLVDAWDAALGVALERSAGAEEVAASAVETDLSAQKFQIPYIKDDENPPLSDNEARFSKNSPNRWLNATHALTKSDHYRFKKMFLSSDAPLAEDLSGTKVYRVDNDYDSKYALMRRIGSDDPDDQYDYEFVGLLVALAPESPDISFLDKIGGYFSERLDEAFAEYGYVVKAYETISYYSRRDYAYDGRGNRFAKVNRTGQKAGEILGNTDAPANSRGSHSSSQERGYGDGRNRGSSQSSWDINHSLLSTEQIDFFKESKARSNSTYWRIKYDNGRGKLLPMYRTEVFGDDGIGGIYWFDTDDNGTSPAYLNIKKPFIADSLEVMNAKTQRYGKQGFYDYLRQKGYDGIVVRKNTGLLFATFDSSQAIDVSNKTPGASSSTDSDTKYQITPAKDEAYMDAVNSGDMETAQRMVDEAAKRAGYTVKAYHGTPINGITVFDNKKIGSTTDEGLFGSGFYFSTNKLTADGYATEKGATMPVYLKVNKPWWGNAYNDISQVAEEIGVDKSTLTTRKAGKRSTVVAPLASYARTFTAHISENGYDSVVVQHGAHDYEIVIFNNKSIKSADPVTRDDNGNVIPLSQRFNTGSDDIRWQLAPLDTLGLTSEDLLGSVDPETIGNKETRAKLKEYLALYEQYKKELEAAGGDLRRVVGLRDKLHAKMRVKPLQELESRVRAHISEEAVRYHRAEVDINVDWHIAEQKQKYGKKIDEITQKYREMLSRQRERKNDQALKEAVRASILKQVKALHKLLTTDTKEKHVPQDLKNAVARVLEVFAADAKLVKAENIGELAYLYRQIQEETGDDALYNPYVEEAIEKIQKALYTKKFTELTVEELQELRDAVRAIAAQVNGENTMFSLFGENSKLTLQESWDKAVFDMESAPRRRLQSEWARKAESLIKTGNMKPVYFFRMLGGEMERLYQDILDGQNTVVARDMFDDRAFVEQMQERYGYKEWGAASKSYKRDLYEYEAEGGEKLTLTREQAMYIYATAKREAQNAKRGDSHLTQGGWVYADEYDRQRKKNEKKKDLRPDLKGHPMKAADIAKLEQWLTDDQKAYADAMVEYLSTTVGGRGNEVSMKLYNIKLFGEKYYFPYRVSGDAISRKPGEYGTKVQNTHLLTAKGFTNKVAQNASAPIVVGDFTDAVAEHMAEMATYHGEAIPQLNLWRVLNYKNKPHTDGKNLKTAIREAYGENAMKYIDLLLADLNGQIVKDPREELGALVNYKYIQTAAKISVAIQQPTAVLRAMAYVNPKYFAAKPIGNKAYEELLRYSGTAVIKSIGGFDMRSGKGAADWVANKPDTLADRMNILAEEADKRTWTLLWGAVKAETKAKTGLAEGSEELLKAAGKRFDEVVELTQVYDSVLTRSQVMRSKSAFMSMVTAYMAEPTVTLNMVLDLATSKSARKPNKAAVLLAVTMSILATNLVKSLWSAAGDDDEDRTYLEKLGRAFAGNVSGDLLWLNYIPILKDVVSIVSGYDVERMDMAPVADLVDALKKLYTAVFEKDVSPAEMVDISAGAVANVANIFGIPGTNILRDVRTVVNIGKMATAEKTEAVTELSTIAKDALAEISVGLYDSTANGDYARLFRKLKQGKTAEYETHRATMVAYEARKLRAAGVSEKQVQKKAEAKVDAKMKSLIRKDYEGDKLTLEESESLLRSYALVEEDDIYYTGREWEYEQDNTDQYSRYGELYAAMDAGKNVDAFVRELTSHGYDKEDVESAMKSHVGSMYREGELTRKQAEQKLTKYLKQSNDDTFWDLRKWDYAIANGSVEGYDKYSDWTDAVRTGKNLDAVIKVYTSHGVKKGELSSAITRAFKEEYLALKEKGREQELKGYLLNAYARLGYKRSDKAKDINAWKPKE